MPKKVVDHSKHLAVYSLQLLPEQAVHPFRISLPTQMGRVVVLVAAGLLSLLAGGVGSTDLCEKIDGDCPVCNSTAILSPTLTVYLSGRKDLRDSARTADNKLRALGNKTDIISFDSLDVGLHTSLFYSCCHSAGEVLKMSEAFEAMEWEPVTLRYNAFSCNLDHAGKIVYLHAMPDSAGQSALMEWARGVEKAMTEAHVPVNHPRKSHFHMTLARVTHAYPVDEAVRALNGTHFGTINFCCFTFLGVAYKAKGGCAEWDECLPLA